MRLPDFLIIGAMKSGTTGLFFDVCGHPQVYMPVNKEPHALCDDKVLTEAGKQEYADLYVAAGADQLVGDASTGYSKLPDRPGVVERAVAVLPEDFRAIYIIREPISRIISQHYHEFSRGLVGADINVVVREHPRYLDFSRYAWQLRPWVEAIGRDRIRVVLFEQYKSSRSAVVAETCRFLGLDPDERPAIDEQEVFNAGDGKPVPGPIWNAIRGNKMYQKLVRPLVSSRARHHLRKYFMRKAPPRPTPPSAETIAWLQQELANDREELAAQWDISPWGDVPAN